MDDLGRCEGFQWDEGNREKNRTRHGVTQAECEQLFSNRPLVVSGDTTHSQGEFRYYALGITDAGRRLFVVFTTRNNLLRVISARDMSRRERRVYESGKEASGTEV